MIVGDPDLKMTLEDSSPPCVGCQGAYKRPAHLEADQLERLSGVLAQTSALTRRAASGVAVNPRIIPAISRQTNWGSRVNALHAIQER